jgi:hypothetical protein
MRAGCRQLCCSPLSIPSESSRQRSICCLRVHGVSIRRMSAGGRVSPWVITLDASPCTCCGERAQSCYAGCSSSEQHPACPPYTKSEWPILNSEPLEQNAKHTLDRFSRALVIVGEQHFHKRPLLSPGQYEDPKTRIYYISKVVTP